jgi:hypothetical protein
MLMLPPTNATVGTRRLVVIVFGAREPFLLASKSRAEWVQKTTFAGVNWEIFWFD